MEKKLIEIDYYKEITSFIETQIKSNLTASGIKDINVFWKNGELKKGLNELIRENHKVCSCFQTYCENVVPLNLDIFGIVTDGIKFEIIILEVKKRKSVGLQQWSQLIGYNLVSEARFGLLINVNNGASQRLQNILITNPNISRIITLKENGLKVDHQFGLMIWNSLTKNFEYSGLGPIGTISSLCDCLIKRFI